MRGETILHPQLARAIAELGHTDTFMVIDAGFPVPRHVERIDLGFWPGLPTVVQILEVMRRAVFVEEVRFAPEVVTHNPGLYAELQRIYTGSGAGFATSTHEQLIEEFAPAAKFIVRSGDFQPWANVVHVASTDPFAWFTDEAIASGLQILPAYTDRRSRVGGNEVPTVES